MKWLVFMIFLSPQGPTTWVMKDELGFDTLQECQADAAERQKAMENIGIQLYVGPYCFAKPNGQPT